MAMNKVLVIGICGAGKSTLALKLSERLDLPVFHLDKYFWKKGWIETPNEEWVSTVEGLVSQDEWIMEGNYSSTFNVRFPKADTIIILDYNPILAITRATKRIISHYGRTRPDMTDGCPERFNWEFYKFMWYFNKNHRPRVEEALRNHAKGKRVLRFSSPKKLNKFLKTL